jgi:hypothetical protein
MTVNDYWVAKMAATEAVEKRLEEEAWRHAPRRSR